MIDNGATLISDDVCVVEKFNDIYLFCPPETKGLLEVRDMGVVTVPFVEQIKLRLVVKLTVSGTNRLPDKDNYFKILGIKYPLLKIDVKIRRLSLK